METQEPIELQIPDTRSYKVEECEMQYLEDDLNEEFEDGWEMTHIFKHQYVAMKEMVTVIFKRRVTNG